MRSGSSMRSARWADDDRPPWVVDLARYELAWRQAARAGRRPVVRSVPVPRRAAGGRPRGGCGDRSPRPTLADLVEADAAGTDPARRHQASRFRSSTSSSSRAAISRRNRPAPALIDEPDVEQVHEMDLILEPEGRQLHAHQGVQGGHGEVGARLGLRDIGSRQQIVRPHLLAGEHDMDGAPHRSLGSVQEEVDARDVLVDEADRLERVDDAGKIVAADQEVNVLRVPDGLLVHRATQDATAWPPMTTWGMPA